MLERLLESWLDNASERSYQLPFCQMLLAEGHTVVHSTRHSPIEFGKDVITIAPDGVPCGFQLKGNPGGRLTLRQLRDIKPQLLELATQPIVFPGIPSGSRHRAYLVTNGEVDEEVIRSLDDLNVELKRQRIGARRIELWQRGRLLQMAIDLGSSLWPSEIEDINTLLQLLVHDGADILPIEKVDFLLRRILLLDESAPKRVSRDELGRRVTSAALLLAVGLKNFSEKDNHYAVMCARTMYVAYLIAAVVKQRFVFTENFYSSAELAKLSIIESLASMCNEVEENEHLIGKYGYSIAPILRARKTLVVGLMSVYWLWCERAGWVDEGHKAFLSNWLPRDFAQSLLWGQGAIPQFLAHYWYLSATDSTNTSEKLMALLVKLVVEGAMQEPCLPSPYFDFEDVTRHVYSEVLSPVEDKLSEETGSRMSYFALGLFNLLVRTNQKLECQLMWPTLTKLTLSEFEPENVWQFALWRSERGDNITYRVSIPKTWSELVEESRDSRIEKVPPAFAADAVLLLLFVLIFPHRCTPEVVRYLGRHHGTVWFIPPPIED